MLVKDKVALVTGGASGIGLCYVKELLKSGAKGVTIADIDSERGEAVVAELSKKYGNRVIFVKVNVVNKTEIEEAMKKTVNTFKHFDIMINNAGIMNDAKWEAAIDINLKGTVNGCLLAMDEYIPKYKSAAEGVVVNISSIIGLIPFGGLPIYAATKHAVTGLSRSLAELPLDKDNIKILTICPGATNTALLEDLRNKTPNNSLEKYHLAFEQWMDKNLREVQEATFVAENVVRLIAEAKNGTIWYLENNEVYEVVLPEKEDLVLKRVK